MTGSITKIVMNLEYSCFFWIGNYISLELLSFYRRGLLRWIPP